MQLSRHSIFPNQHVRRLLPINRNQNLTLISICLSNPRWYFDINELKQIETVRESGSYSLSTEMIGPENSASRIPFPFGKLWLIFCLLICLWLPFSLSDRWSQLTRAPYRPLSKPRVLRRKTWFSDAHTHLRRGSNLHTGAWQNMAVKLPRTLGGVQALGSRVSRSLSCTIPAANLSVLLIPPRCVTSLSHRRAQSRGRAGWSILHRMNEF